MSEQVRCGTCGLAVREPDSDPGYWVDADGWFVSEEPLLHAHRPAVEHDVVVVLRDAGLSMS